MNIARKKWEVLVEREKASLSNKVVDQSFIDISEDDFEYEIEEIDEDYIVPFLDTNKIAEEMLKPNPKNILKDEFE